MKKIIIIFNLKNKTGKADVECVKDVFGKMGAGQNCEDIVDVIRGGKWSYYYANNRGVQK